MDNENVGKKNYVGLGIGVGLLFGVILGNIPIGMLFRLAIGLGIKKQEISLNKTSFSNRAL